MHTTPLHPPAKKGDKFVTFNVNYEKYFTRIKWEEPVRVGLNASIK